MIWVKIRHMFAWGYDNWFYKEIPENWKEYGYGPEDYADKEKVPDWQIAEGYDEERALGEFLMNELSIGESHSFSDKYRGIEYEIVETAPFSVIKRKLERAKSYAEHYANEVERLQKMLDKEGEIKKEDMEL